MTSERDREKQIEEIYRSALERRGEDRRRYVDGACGGDAMLREGVESLLERTGSDLFGETEVMLPESLEPGRELGPYRIASTLGRGGMGVVYGATDTRLDRRVAIKVLPADLALDPERRQRFEREARVVGQLNHPHICALYDIGETDGIRYIVMEYVEGETLEARLRDGPIRLDEAWAYGIQIGEALDRAHRGGIVHRDLKPGNVMLTETGVKLLDFGLAKLVEGSPVISPEEGSSGSAATPLTEEGTILGTLQYMAPEQLEGEATDSRTDIFAFGAILYEMVTGRKAFKGKSQASLMAAILKDEPTPMRELQPAISPDQSQTISRCLAKNANERWPSAHDLVAQLRADSGLSPTESASGIRIPVSPPIPPRGKRGMPVLVGLGVLILLAGAWFGGRMFDPAARLDAGLEEIEAYIEGGDWEAAYALYLELQEVAPDDPDLLELEPGLGSRLTLTSDPPGARVSRRVYDGTEDDWIELGTTPLENTLLPQGLSRVRLELDGYETVLQTVHTLTALPAGDRHFTLDPAGSLEGMVRVPGFTAVLGGEPTTFADFFMDRYEVTNREFKAFVDADGYARPEFWEALLEDTGRVFEEAIAPFTDRLGIAGPLTWSAGDYPDGEDEYPVAVSWYEAVAYGKFVGKELPTVHHMLHAIRINPISHDHEWVLPASNLEGSGPAPVGEFDSLNWAGTYDLTGNLREWTLNRAGGEHYRLGASWEDPSYMASVFRAFAAPADERSETTGFRLVRTEDAPEIMARARAPLQLLDPPDWRRAQPASDEVFAGYRDFYAYDRGPLEAQAEAPVESEDWTMERVTFNATYDDRVVLYLFLPRNAEPPYQTVVYIPGLDAWQKNAIDLERFELDYLVRAGRAVALPVVRGTYGRTDEFRGPMHNPTLVSGRTATVRVVQDVFRTVDYLVEREDIDPDGLAFYGTSFGAAFGAYVLALEPRFQTGIFNLIGLPMDEVEMFGTPYRPEVRTLNFLPHIEMPILHFAAELDALFPMEASARPWFDFMTALEEGIDKEFSPVPGGHNLMNPTIQARRTLDWLDERLGPVP